MKQNIPLTANTINKIVTVRTGTPTPITTPIIILLVWVKSELAVTFVKFAVLEVFDFTVVFGVTVELVELVVVGFVVFVVVGFVVFVVVGVVVVFVFWRMRSIKTN